MLTSSMSGLSLLLLQPQISFFQILLNIRNRCLLILCSIICIENYYGLFSLTLGPRLLAMQLR